MSGPGGADRWTPENILEMMKILEKAGEIKEAKEKFGEKKETEKPQTTIH